MHAKHEDQLCGCTEAAEHTVSDSKVKDCSSEIGMFEGICFPNIPSGTNFHFREVTEGRWTDKYPVGTSTKLVSTVSTSIL